jgi:hypothetical protein
MKYSVAWGDGATEETGFGAPAIKSHAYGCPGFNSVTATPVVDTAGRGPGRPTSRNVYLRPFVFGNIGDLTTLAMP